MVKQPARSKHIKPRQIIGFSLPPDRAAAVKIEAARRGITLKELFEEMWALYEKTTRKMSDEARKSQ